MLTSFLRVLSDREILREVYKVWRSEELCDDDIPMAEVRGVDETNGRREDIIRLRIFRGCIYSMNGSKLSLILMIYG